MRAVALLLAPALCLALESDKRAHAVAGAAIGTAGYASARALGWSCPAAIATGLLSSAAAGAAKEWLYDARNRDRHTVDARDFWYTAGGGAGAVALCVGVDLAVSASRSGGSVTLSWRH